VGFGCRQQDPLQHMVKSAMIVLMGVALMRWWLDVYARVWGECDAVMSAGLVLVRQVG
jgi:hypothetical protein